MPVAAAAAVAGDGTAAGEVAAAAAAAELADTAEDVEGGTAAWTPPPPWRGQAHPCPRLCEGFPSSARTTPEAPAPPPHASAPGCSRAGRVQSPLCPRMARVAARPPCRAPCDLPAS